MTTWIWTGLLVFVVLMIALALGVFQSQEGTDGPSRADL
jgi:hypothetical protein